VVGDVGKNRARVLKPWKRDPPVSVLQGPEELTGSHPRKKKKEKERANFHLV